MDHVNYLFKNSQVLGRSSVDFSRILIIVLIDCVSIKKKKKRKLP